MSDFETIVTQQGAFNPQAFTSAFQLAQSYAVRRRRSRGGRPGQGYLVPYGPIYPDEKMVIIRAKIGNAEPWTEQHYKYLEKNDEPIAVTAAATESIQFRIAENWLNIQTPITITAKRIEYAED